MRGIRMFFNFSFDKVVYAEESVSLYYQYGENT